MKKKSEEVMNNRRLRAIKLKFVVFQKQCRCCGDFVAGEKMYVVSRWGTNKTIHDWYYCQECMHSKEDVLKQIYSDENRGIAYVDEYSPRRPAVQLEEIERLKSNKKKGA